MSTLILTALLLLAIGLFFIDLFLRKKDKNPLLHGGVLVVVGPVDLVVGGMIG